MPRPTNLPLPMLLMKSHCSRSLLDERIFLQQVPWGSAAPETNPSSPANGWQGEFVEDVSAEGLGVTDRVPFVRKTVSKPDAKKHIREQRQIPNSIFIARFENYTVQKFWNHTQNN